MNSTNNILNSNWAVVTDSHQQQPSCSITHYMSRSSQVCPAPIKPDASGFMPSHNLTSACRQSLFHASGPWSNKGWTCAMPGLEQRPRVCRGKLIREEDMWWSRLHSTRDPAANLLAGAVDAYQSQPAAACKAPLDCRWPESSSVRVVFIYLNNHCGKWSHFAWISWNFLDRSIKKLEERAFLGSNDIWSPLLHTCVSSLFLRQSVGINLLEFSTLCVFFLFPIIVLRKQWWWAGFKTHRDKLQL